jgi:DNA-binding MarR family transcriptional regulator
MPATPRAARSKGLGYLIADINRLMRKEFDRRVRALGLTRAQWLFITYLVRTPGCTQSDLAEAMQLEKITVSRQATRLLRGGWIRRRDHAEDARAYRLHPTPKAVRMQERLAVLAAALRTDYLRGLPAPRVTALVGDLALIKDNLLRMDHTAKRLSA